MNYIGIKGHRGAGKKTIAYLLGNTINYLIEGKEDVSFDDAFNKWCDDIMSDENVIQDVSLTNVYFDSFGDTPKVLVGLLLGCDTSYLYDDYHKDHVVINLRDFSHKEYEEIPDDIKLYNSQELYVMFSKNTAPAVITKNTYTTLREFIMYFGREVMQRFFGVEVWIKSLKSNADLFTNIFNDDNAYRIYYDIKAPSETTYILNKNGVVVKVDRPGHKKKNSILNRSNDNRSDYQITIKDSIYNLKNDILVIAKNIIDKNNEKGNSERS